MDTPLDTLLKENARLKEAVAARDGFLAVAAHELMNGLSPVIGRVDVLRRKFEALPAERVRQELDHIAGLTAQFAKRASTLLDISRITTGVLHVDRVVVDGNKIAANVVNGYQPVAELAGCALTLTRSGENTLIGDPLSLEQILDNIISNAIKYGAGKPIDVSVTSDADAGLVRFHVRDNGQGISPENQQRIFERFERAVEAGSTTGGFGVGLWVVAQLTAAMGGQVMVSSQRNQGTTFCISLPFTYWEETGMTDGENEAIAPALARLRSGIPGLDIVLGGGFMQGGMYIVEGLPGAGKTIFTTQICFTQVADGGKALFVTLLAENHSRMMSNMRELSFFDQSRIPDQLTYLSAFNEVKEGGLKSLLDLLRREIMRRRINLLVIDGLVSAHTSAASDQAFKEFIHDLQEIAIATECTMFLTTTAREIASPEQTMVDGLIQLTNRGYGWQTASDLQITKLRGSAFLRGRHSYKITSSGIVIYPRIEALYAQPDNPDRVDAGIVSSGVKQLDNLLNGGLPEASTSMLVGPSGIGKTTLGLQFLAACTPGEPGLMFGFYETPARLRAKIDRMSFPLGEMLDSGQVEIKWQTPTSDLLDAYGDRLLETVKRQGIKRLFIDGLTAFHSAAIDPSRIGNFFSALANELRGLGVTTLYSLEMSDVFDPKVSFPVKDTSSLAENIFLLRYVAARSRVHRMISIVKVRDGGFDPTLHTFTIGNSGIEISSTNEEAEKILSDFNGNFGGPAPSRSA